jgi:hypothetical protein
MHAFWTRDAVKLYKVSCLDQNIPVNLFLIYDGIGFIFQPKGNSFELQNLFLYLKCKDAYWN